jgi:SAM-dependent methyltransferase
LNALDGAPISKNCVLRVITVKSEHGMANTMFKISVAQASGEAYRNALNAELEVGASMNLEAVAKLAINKPEILAYKARLLGGTQSTLGFADWTRFLLSEFGPRKRCFSLGSGLGRVEKFLVELGFAPAFESIELCAEVNGAIRDNDKRVMVAKGDLNFVELPEDTYDFILCHGVLHHLINIEHVLAEITKALTADGVLLIYEYVGETRWQFTEERMRWLSKAFPKIQFRVPPIWSVTGFESVRSSELLSLIEAQFYDSTLHSVSYGGVYFPFVTATKPDSDVNMRRVVELDAEVSATGLLLPCYHMGVYRKSRRQVPPPRPWSDDELQLHLQFETPILVRAIRGLKLILFT